MLMICMNASVAEVLFTCTEAFIIPGVLLVPDLMNFHKAFQLWMREGRLKPPPVATIVMGIFAPRGGLVW